MLGEYKDITANTPYPDLNGVLNELVINVRYTLGDTFIGSYLQGSLAVGGFDQDSDVDFIMVIDRELSCPQVECLQSIHESIYILDSE